MSDMPPPTIVSQEWLRRSILRRQGLIVPFDEPLQAVRAMVAVQTQYAASLSVAVSTRLKRSKFGWDDLALRPDGELIKSWSLRHTLHAHTREDHLLVVGSLGTHLYSDYLKFMQDRRSISSIQVIERQILEALSSGPLSRKDLHNRVPELRSIEGVGWGLDVMGLAFLRRVCVVGRGANQMFCALPHRHVEPSYGELLKRYLVSFGPASVADFAFWTGLKAPHVKKAFSEVHAELIEVQIEGLKGPRFALPGTMEDEPEGNLGVRLLAKFDPLVLAHKDKSVFIAHEHKQRVFRKAGQVEAVVLMDGLAAGTWRLERKGKSAVFVIESFRPYRKREHSRLEAEAERIAKATGSGLAVVQFV